MTKVYFRGQNIVTFHTLETRARTTICVIELKAGRRRALGAKRGLEFDVAKVVCPSKQVDLGRKRGWWSSLLEGS